MTALCAGGTSSPRPGVAGVVSLGSQAIIQLLVGNKYKWLTFAAAWLPIDLIDVNTFCSTDPPAQPTFTTAEVNALLELQFLTPDWTSALAKMGELVKMYAWYSLCQCDNTTELTPPTAQAQPAGSGTVLYTNYQRCTPANPHSDTIAAGVNTYQKQWSDLFTQAPWSFTGTPQQVELFMYNTPLGGVHGSFDYRARFFTDALGNVEVTDDVFTVASGTSKTATLNVPAGALGLSLYTRYQQAGITDNPNNKSWLLCAPDTSGVGPCCPPDTVAVAVLEEIRENVRLLQRYKAPFAYIAGAVHSGLTGTGSFAIPRLLGLRLEVTGRDAEHQVLGNPPYVFDLGWCSIADGLGMVEEVRLTRDNSVWLPIHMTDATVFAYALRNGVTLRVTELAAEP